MTLQLAVRHKNKVWDVMVVLSVSMLRSRSVGYYDVRESTDVLLGGLNTKHAMSSCTWTRTT